jgi:hypothetical protein
VQRQRLVVGEPARSGLTEGDEPFSVVGPDESGPEGERPGVLLGLQQAGDHQRLEDERAVGQPLVDPPDGRQLT